VGESDTEIVVVVAAHPIAATGSVRILMDSGALIERVDGWSYVTPGVVSSVVPAIGQIGTQVTINGAGLMSGASSLVMVTLASETVGSIVSNTNSMVVIIASASSGAKTGDVVLIASTGAVVTSGNAWEYIQTGEIQSVSPAQGQIGTMVVISGERLRGASSAVVTVMLGSLPATITSQSNTEIQVEVHRSNAATAGPVTVYGAEGSVITEANVWTYLQEGVIDRVEPNFGQRGTVVTISGRRMLGGGTRPASVELVGVAATVASFSDTSIELVVASGTVGLGNVVITSDTGSIVTSVGGFTYLVEGSISTVQPSQGQLGTNVLIAGSNLLGGGTLYTSISLGGVEIASYLEVISDTVVVVTASESFDAGNGEVKLVSDTGAIVSSNNMWSYDTPSQISSITPTSGQFGTMVTISGTNLLGVSNGDRIETVTLNGVEAELVWFEDQSELIVIAQHGLASGAAGNRVYIEANSGASAVLDEQWSYIERGQIASITPATGQIGTEVTIAGTNLLGGGSSTVRIQLDGVDADVTSSSNSEVLAVVNYAEFSQGTVVLTSDSGAVINSETSIWTYGDNSAVNDVQPRFGQEGTRVTITGDRLRGHAASVTTVTLAGVQANITYESDEMVLVVAAHYGGDLTGSVELTAITGALTTLANGFEYRTAGVIDAVTPTSGQLSTRVNLTGSNMMAHASALADVTLAGVAASVVSRSNALIELVADQGPAAGDTGDVVITAASGGVITLADGWQYVDEGVISRVVPSRGHIGTEVVISGTNLCGGGSELVSVTLGTVPMTIAPESSCDIVLGVADDFATDEAVSGDVVITSNSGAVVTAVGAWTYLVRGRIESVEPTAGVTGTLVTISGVNVLGGGSSAVVTLNGMAASVITAVDDEIVVSANPGSGIGNVVVTADTGAVIQTTNNIWTYSEILAISPDNGQYGTRVVVGGRGLRGGGSNVQQVTVCGTVVAELLSESDTSVEFVVPVVSTVVPPQPCDVVVFAGELNTEVVLTDGLRYRVPGSIASIEPNSGHHGTRVTVSGSDLFGGGTSLVSASFAGVNAIIDSQDDSNIAVRIQQLDAATSFTGDVVLTSESGAVVTSSDGWTYVPQAGIAQLHDDVGQLGTVTAITGTGLLMGGTSLTVTLANVSAEVISISATNVTIRVAGGTPTQGDVLITADTGAFVRQVNGWTQGEAGFVSRVVPGNGWAGFDIEIFGSNLRGSGNHVSTVTLANIAAEIVFENNTLVAVTVGLPNDPYVGRTGDIVLVADTGAIITEEDGWTYNVAGNVTAITPASGRDGTRVVIEGTDLLGRGTSLQYVTLNGVAAVLTPTFSETRIEVVAAASLTAGVGNVEILSSTNAHVIYNDGWEQVASGTVSQVSPVSGQFGTQVTITGSDLLGGGDSATEIRLGGVVVDEIVSAQVARTSSW
jgi:hypothetical protein